MLGGAVALSNSVLFFSLDQHDDEKCGAENRRSDQDCGDGGLRGEVFEKFHEKSPFYPF